MLIILQSQSLLISLSLTVDQVVDSLCSLHINNACMAWHNGIMAWQHAPLSFHMLLVYALLLALLSLR